MPRKRAAAEQDSSDSETGGIVNVDFEFFDPRPIDYIALKRLLTQLFQGDAEHLYLHELAELVISQPLIGTTIKLDGIESDPYAYLTVINLAVHKENPAIKALINYVLEKAASSSSLQSTLHELLSSSDRHIGLVLSERLINMPVQTVPPMYQMLSREIQWAIDENEPFSFSHYLFISRTWRSRGNTENDMADPMPAPSKRIKVDTSTSTNNDPTNAVQSFHPEDTEIMRFASHAVDYEFTKKLDREREALGFDTGGRIILIPSERFPLLVEELARVYPAPTPTV